jgi:ADP-heptose:LPS heptosyltransferase
VILVLRALGVGDLLTGVPALRGLRTHFAGERLCLAAPAGLAPLVALTGAVDELMPVAGLDDRPDWPRPAPRVAVNLHGRGPQSHRLLAEAGAPRLIGFDRPGAPQWKDDEHEVDRWCRLLAGHDNACDPADLELLPPPPADVPAGATVVHPGAKAALRRWPVERFAEVARGLSAEGHHVVVTGSAGERELALGLADLAGLPAHSVVRTDLAALAALVAQARLVVSGDTGIAHLATAYGTPSVVLFGPMSPDRWGPPRRRQHRAIWHGTAVEPGDGPGREPHPALLKITPGEVLTAARSVAR